MRFLFIAVAAAVLAACSDEIAKTSVPDVKTVSIAEDTRVAAVLIRADWCSSCKIIEPKLTEVKIDGPIDGLQHITMDYTDRDKDAFYAAAEKLGVGDAVRDHLEGDVKTGIILLVDMETKSVVADLRKELSEDELKAAMEKSVA